MGLDEILMEAEEKMEKTISVAKQEFGSVRSGKASPDLVNNLIVDAYGTNMKLKELAAITTPDSRMIMIQPWDGATLDPIRKALEESRLGINPVVDGRLIRLPIPALSEERRQDLVKQVKKLAEESRVGVRNSRRHALDEIKKSKEITEDEAERGEKEIQKLTDHYSAEIDKLMATKEAELLKV